MDHWQQYSHNTRTYTKYIEKINASRSKRQKEKLEEDYKEHYIEIKLSTRDNERKHIDIIAKGTEDAANNGEQNSQYKRVI